MEIENVIFLGQISTIMRSSTSKDGNLLSQFDNINEDIGVDENATSDNIRSTSLQKMLVRNHTEANRGKIRGQLSLEDKFCFCKTFKKITKNLGFQLTFKTNNLQNIIYTTIPDATQINVTIISL